MKRTRRDFLFASAAMFAAAVVGPRRLAQATTEASGDLQAEFAAIEQRLNARLGVFILDTETNRRWSHRPDERFPMCSTFKLLASAAVLTKVDAGEEDLGRRIRFEQSDVVTWSPVTKDRVDGEGMTLGELCEAAITLSDNTAGNLILRTLGGPAGLTAFARSLGDDITRLDRWETELNEAIPGDPRDTTTPRAMAANVQALILGEALSQPSREQLISWLVANKTGDAKLRAGLPSEWRIGDKTAGGERGTMADVAVVWPTNRKPVVVSVYLTQTEASSDDRNAAIAEVGRLVERAVR